jgi:SAM-dependent methyltransferase
MPTITDHYENFLADHYNWISGGWEMKAEENMRFFETHLIRPKNTRTALDLGAGSGFQSIPLAQLGFNVMAIDLSEKLLSELKSRGGGFNITAVKDDLLNFPDHCAGPIELCVCMGDTLTHLESKGKIAGLFQQAYAALGDRGKLILSYRDLTFELKDLDRFIPVRSDEERIFTCYLEYEPEHVKVHDLVYEKAGNAWTLKKSFYRKIRVPFEWTKSTLTEVGFKLGFAQVEKGLATVIAVKD